MSEQCEHPEHDGEGAIRSRDLKPGDRVLVTETRTWEAEVEHVFPDGGLSLRNVTWQPRSRDSGRLVFGVGDGRAVTKGGSHVTVVRNVTGIPSRDSHVTGIPSRDSHVTPENEGHVTPPLRDS